VTANLCEAAVVFIGSIPLVNATIEPFFARSKMVFGRHAVDDVREYLTGFFECRLARHSVGAEFGEAGETVGRARTLMRPDPRPLAPLFDAAQRVECALRRHGARLEVTDRT
jgi:hypothetical protein